MNIPKEISALTPNGMLVQNGWECSLAHLVQNGVNTMIKMGSTITFNEYIPRDGIPSIKPGINGKVLDMIDNVYMVIPFNSGHAMIVRIDQISEVN